MLKRNQWLEWALIEGEALAKRMGSSEVTLPHVILAALKNGGTSTLQGMINVAEYEKRLKNQFPHLFDNAKRFLNKKTRK